MKRFTFQLAPNRNASSSQCLAIHGKQLQLTSRIQIELACPILDGEFV